MPSQPLTITGVGTGPEHALNPQLRVYPNPASSWITVALGQPSPDRSIVLLDYSGRLCARYSFTSQTRTINTSELATGIYLIVVQSGTAHHVQRLNIARQTR